MNKNTFKNFHPLLKRLLIIALIVGICLLIYFLFFRSPYTYVSIEDFTTKYMSQG